MPKRPWLSGVGKVLRTIPAGFRGKGRFARAMLAPYLRTEDVVLCNRHGESYLVPHLSESIAFNLFIHGEYEPLTRQLLLENLPPGGAFVDVGANIGIFTVAAANRVGPTGHVVAIEASPRIYPYLEHNIRLNQIEHVRTKRCAAYDQNGETAFWEAPADHFGMGSLAPQFHDEPTKVETRTLDSLVTEYQLQHIDVLKVDVEGCEAAVFRGALGLLTRPDPPLVLFEFLDWAEQRSGHQPGDAQRLLRSLGYGLWRLDRDGMNQPPLEGVLETGGEMLVARKLES